MILCQPKAAYSPSLGGSWREVSRIMKLTAIILLSACLTASAKGFSQTVTLSEKNAPLEKVFKEIKKQTGYNFLYTLEQLNQAGNVNIQLRNASLQEALAQCLQNTPLTYTIVEKTVVIKRKEVVIPDSRLTTDDSQPPPPIDVHGRIVNEKGEPVAGATIKIKGTDKGTSTNENGEFTLKGVDANATLVISGVNIESFEINVNERNDLAVMSAKTKVTIGETVTLEANTGYQKIKPNETTGSIVQVNNELFNRSISTDILSRLNGNAPGVLYNGGSAGLDILTIRSRSSIFGNVKPLIVVDNFPYTGDILSINPNDVENITILKDAASASIWGMMASNGVIVITTKTGKYNQGTSVSLNTNLTVSQRSDFFSSPQMSIGDYIDVEKFLFDNNFYDPQISSAYYPVLSPAVEILLKKRNGLLTDAEAATQLQNLKNIDLRHDKEKYLFHQPINQQYSISLNGGSSNDKYYLSIGWDKNLQAKIGNEFSRLSVNANNTYGLINNKLEITTGFIYAENISDINEEGLTINYPYAKLADDNGNPLPVARYRQGYIDTAGAGKLLDWNYRPLDEMNLANDVSKGIRYRLNTGMKLKVIKGLDVEIKYQYGKEFSEIKNLRNSQTFYTRDYINSFSSIDWSSGTVTRPVPLGGILDINSSTLTIKNYRGQINYNRNWNSLNEVSALFGGEVAEANVEGETRRLYGYDENKATDIAVDYINTFNNYITGLPSTINRNSSITNLSNRNVSAFFNSSYTYNKRYSISVSARKDASNILGVKTNQKWTPLWSIGGAWNISSETFYHVEWLSKLKLRSSYGYQGNVDNSISALLTTAESSPNRWNLPTTIVANSPNSELRWEKTKILNIAVDYSIFKNIISGSIEYYWKKGVDLIGIIPLAPSLGVPSFRGNTSDMKGKGFDFSIESHNLNGALKWYTNFWFSYAKDWVTDYKTNLAGIANYIESSDINPIVGRPVRSLYSYKWGGLDPATGDPQGYLNKTLSKDYGSIRSITDLSEMVYSGPIMPTHFGALRNTFEWKNFLLSFNITYKFGYYFRRSSVNYNNLFNRGTFGNKDYTLRWKQSGDELHTNVPSLVFPADLGRDNFYQYSEVLVEKGDHIRFQDVTISYNLRNLSLGKSMKVRDLKVYVNGSNLGIIWRANKLKLDPDESQTDNTIAEPKVISAGVKIDF